MELPTINIAQGQASGSEYMGSPVFRRQHRKQGSTVFVAAPEETTSESQSNKIPLGFVAKGVGALAGAQALGKLVSFILNQMLLRVVSSTDLGQSSRIELWGATILSLTRDAVRFAAVRETLYTKAEDRYNRNSESVHGTKSGTMQETVNIGYLPLLLGIPLVGILMVIAWKSSIDPLLRAASGIWVASILIELISEPCFLLHQLKMNMGLRARVESVAAILRCLVTLVLVVSGHSTLLAFALGQLAFAIGLCTGYFSLSIAEWHYAGFKLYPQRVCNDNNDTKLFFDPRIFTLARGMYLQSLFKYLLTESDRILISLILPLAKQGEYALATNYGSLFARLLLFPVEESLRTLFAKTLKSNKTEQVPDEQEPLSPPQVVAQQQQPAPLPAQNLGLGIERSASLRARSSSFNARGANGNRSRSSSFTTPLPPSPLVGQKQLESEKLSDTDTAKTALSTILRIYLYLGIGAVTVGVYIAPFFLRSILSSSWASSEAPQVLAAYICYIPILAWNGSLEAFVQSVASIEDLKRQSKMMVALAVIFIVTAYVFMNLFGLGAKGLVYAQMFNMLLRTAWSFGYVEAYFEKYNIHKWWLAAVPKPPTLIIGGVVLILSWLVGPIYSATILALHLALGLVLVAAFAYEERKHLLNLIK